MKYIPLLLSLAMVLQAAPAEEVNVYSGRKEALIKPLFDRFTEETGIRVNLVTGNADALIKRLELEGERSPADLLVTVDAGRLPPGKGSRFVAGNHVNRTQWSGTGKLSRPPGILVRPVNQGAGDSPLQENN